MKKEWMKASQFWAHQTSLVTDTKSINAWQTTIKVCIYKAHKQGPCSAHTLILNENHGFTPNIIMDLGSALAPVLKPILNWANVYSPNILRTVLWFRRFLIELLIRRTWLGQFDELYFVLNWLVMRCKLRPELAADAHQTAWSKM